MYEEEYRKLFDQVHASQRLKEEVLRMREQRDGAPRRRVMPGAVLAAILAALVLAGTTLAAVGGSLGDWFTRRWGEATGGSMTQQQTRVIDSLTQKVGESRTSGDITVTVDSITVGGDVLWALVDVEGIGFDEKKIYSFDRIGVEILPDPSEGAVGGAGCSMRSIGVTESGAVRMLLEYTGVFSTGNQLNSGGYTLELRLHDLVRCRQGGEDTVIAQGAWRFSIPLTVESLSPVISIGSAVMEEEVLREGADGALEKVTREVELRDISLTATGVSFRTDESCDLLDVAALFADGTEVVSRIGGGSRMEDGTWYSSHQWPVPIDVEQVTALRIGETEIPLPWES